MEVSYNRIYYLRNCERLKEKQRAYYAANRDKIRAKRKTAADLQAARERFIQYLANPENREKRNEAKRRQYWANRQKECERKRAYRLRVKSERDIVRPNA